MKTKMDFYKRHLLQSLNFSSFRRYFLPSFIPRNGNGASITHCGMQTSCLSNTADVLEFDCDELLDDGKAVEKHTALHLALSRLTALGIGGLPKGRMVEIYGKEASGKTTLALHIIKEAQKLGGYCAYLDVENAMDPLLAESVGVDADDLLISRPDSAENMLNVVDTLTKSASVDVIVVDSVAALVPQCELEAPIGSIKGCMQSQVMTKALRKIQYSLCQSKTLIIFLNQVRFNPRSNEGLGHMDEVTCGGNALKFYAAVRLRISRIGLLKTEEKIHGLGICIQVVKNKLAPAMKKAELEIQFGRGIRCESEVLGLALEHGLVLKEGNSYFIEGEVFSNKQAAERYLSENEGILDKMVSSLRSLLFERLS
ncbi:hypothetical protein Nepgr_009986 [Nepenthes gracilis]|uniref:DNA repair protein recA homolog 2, mitochondrial n=1 Tax=Nepenthes gracilis TaxID=150966 RepID=A0AAD3XKY6_NEPGR|nr:hypothetical protein Nepgr_009986 [Nepenthes gracilis]